MPKAQNLVLTQSQAACLIALRHGNENQPKIALAAKLILSKTGSWNDPRLHAYLLAITAWLQVRVLPGPP